MCDPSGGGVKQDGGREPLIARVMFAPRGDVRSRRGGLPALPASRVFVNKPRLKFLVSLGEKLSALFRFGSGAVECMGICGDSVEESCQIGGKR